RMLLRWTVFSILNPTTKRQLSHPENPTACDEQQQCHTNRYLRLAGAGLCQFLCGLRFRVGGRGRELDATKVDSLVLRQIAHLVLKVLNGDTLSTIDGVLPDDVPLEHAFAGLVLEQRLALTLRLGVQV